jgi:hypothetical protein
MQGMKCSDITFVALKLIPIPLLHSLFLPKPKCMYNHYELFLLQHPQPGFHRGLYLQVSLRQIPTNVKLVLLFEVHSTFLDS